MTFPLIIAVIQISASIPVALESNYWWDGDLTKEIPQVKKSLENSEGKLTVTGYESKDQLIPMIKSSLKDNQLGGFNEEKFVRLCALVYRGRNAPGIESESLYKSAKSHCQLVLSSWDRKVNSLSFIRMCALIRYEFSYEGPKPTLDFIKKIRPYAKNDIVFNEALVRFMGFNYKSFDKNDILEEARKLAKHDRGIYIHARTAGQTIRTVAFFKKDKKLLAESIELLKKYRSGMQVIDPAEKKKFDEYLRRLSSAGDNW
ncbi:MAG: hypothetical protein ACKVQS_04295 [Fimbriimonadaceae bacterium]